MSRHLSRPSLQALLESRPGPGAQAGAHLLVCPKCQAKLRSMSPSKADGVLEGSEVSAPITEFVELRSAEQGRTTARDFREACRLARTLPKLAAIRRREAVLASDLPAIPLVAGILTMLPGLFRDSPEDVVDLCRVSLELLSPEGLDVSSRSHAGILADLEANLANALRVLAQLPEAQRHMASALSLANEAPDDHVRGGVLLNASLVARDARNFESALELAGLSKRLFRRVGNLRQTKRVSRVEASVAFLQGNFSSVIAKVTALLRDPTLEQGARFSATFMLVKALILEGSAFEAASLLPRLAGLARSLPGDRVATRLCWLRGLIVGRVADPDVGDRLMSQARDECLDQGLLYDAALVALDMAMVRYEAGQHRQAIRHAASIVRTFAATGAHREALAALRCFHASVKAQNDVCGRYRELQLYLPLARRDPNYGYRPGFLDPEARVH